MYYRLYWNGKPYTKTKYESKEEAKAAAAEYNSDSALVRKCGAVYVANKFGQYVA